MMKDIFQFLEKRGILILGISCILPFLILSYFIHPVGTHGWDWATQYPGELPSGLNFFEQQNYWYNNVMGRYSSTAAMSLTHFWFSISTFKIFPVVFIVGMIGSLFYLLKNMMNIHKVTSSQLVHTGILALAIFIIYLDQLTGIYEAFYNLSCVLTWQLGGISFFILVGLMIRILTKQKSKSIGNLLLISFSIFFTVGTNEICLVATNGWLSLLILGSYFYYRKWHKWVIGLFVFSLLCSFLEILAPGNFVRMDLSERAQNPILAIFLTLSVSTFNWIRWFSTTPILVFAILYLPIGIRLANNRNSIFKYPLFGVIGLISFHWLSLLLLFWSQGDDTLPERFLDMIFWISLPLLFYIWQCWIVLFLEKKWISPTLIFSPIIRFSLFGFVLLHLFFSGLKIDKSDNARNTSNYLSIIQTNSNIGNAWLEILNGNASTYNKEQYLIYEKVKNSTQDTCFIIPSTVEPKIIYDETYDRKTKNGEHFMSHYFGKQTIVKYRKD